MKSLGVAALVVIASWCASCESVSAQAPETTPAPAAVNSTPATTTPAATAPGTAPATAPATTPATPATPAPATTAGETKSAATPVPAPADSSNEQAVVNESSAGNAHLSTPGGETTSASFPAFRQFLEDSQNAHDKMIVDRFLIGVAILFAVIAAALYFSLPPKRREQKE